MDGSDKPADGYRRAPDDPDVHRLSVDGRPVILVGTAHVSPASARLVAATIAAERPDTVCVELCASRYQALRNPGAWQEMDIFKVIREKKAPVLLSNLLLASFQRRLADKFDIQPGQEMLQAIESADAAGARVHLADRDIRTTLGRAWRSMGLWGKLKLMLQLILSMGQVGDIEAEDIERLKKQDVLEALLADLGKSMPVLRTILIDERDHYLAEKIRTAPGETVVAVVGAGHVPGIKRGWGHPVDLTPLDHTPPPGRLGKTLKWLLPGIVLILMVGGFYRGGASSGVHMLTWWVAANGVFAGLGALLALAHPLTVLTSVLAAPLTSLNPMLAAGWVSGLVEAMTRRPKVRDVERLPRDILTVRGFWRNHFTRVLLVVVFTNLGSSLGTFVAIPLMVSVF